MTQRLRSRSLLIMLVGTVFLLGLDLSSPGSTSVLRTGAAAAFGPLERALTMGRDDHVARLTREQDQIAGVRRQDDASVRRAREITSVLASPAAGGARLLPARVVAFAPGTSSSTGASSGERRVTLDVGERDGVSKDLTVIAGAGLVGRVIAVAPWTSDVLVVGDRDLTVGVRVGREGRLGSVSAKAPAGATAARRPGGLSLTLLQRGTVGVGDPVTTLGSIGGRPFIPDIPLGTVVSVDPDRGQLTSSAVVEPVVDIATLNVVAVVLSTQRSVPRPSISGSAR